MKHKTKLLLLTLFNFFLFLSFLFIKNISFDPRIMIEFRIPRYFLAIVSGISLSLSGLILQTVFQNPLAEPYVLGFSGGSVVAILIGELIGLTGTIFRPFLGIIGGFSVIIILFTLYLFSPYTHIYSQVYILVIGILLNAITSGFIVLLSMILKPFSTHSILSWLMGYLPIYPLNTVLLILITTIFVSIIVTTLHKYLFAFLLSEVEAINLGVNVGIYRALFLAISGILTVLSVSFVGIIGFLGLVSPHLSRILFKDIGAKMVIGTALIGMLLIGIATILSVFLFEGMEVPIGVATSIICVPIFLYILAKMPIWEHNQ